MSASPSLMRVPDATLKAEKARLDIKAAADLPGDKVLGRLGSSSAGLTGAEATARLARFGPNALVSHGTSPWRVLMRQVNNPLLVLLIGAALVSGFTGDKIDATIISVIVAMSVGLGFFNEFRSERAVEALHNQLRHQATVLRDAKPVLVDVTDVVPGDIATLRVGDIVPADMRLLSATELECDEGVLTGESMASIKQVEPVTGEHGPQELLSCAFMGTIVRQGAGTGVVIETGPATAFGRIAAGLGEQQAQTAFQVGLRQFSSLLVRVAGVMTVAIFIINLVLHRPFLQALLFSLAIAIGLTPQLLPAIVTISLSTGARRLAAKKVLVKRLVAIEDLGNVTILFTDKTGTLTEGQVRFDQALGATGEPNDRVLLLGLLCNEAVVDDGKAVSGNQLDMALWEPGSDQSAVARTWTRLGIAPFDHERRLASVVATRPHQDPVLITKGEPEAILARCVDVSAAANATLVALSDAGARVIAVGTKPAGAVVNPRPQDEQGLTFKGFLTFVDRPKADAAQSLHRLAELGVVTKVITGDSERVARKVCGDFGLDTTTVLTGAQIDTMDDSQLAAAIATTFVFARMAPEQKSRIIRVARSGSDVVAFLGDGVNDAVALHHADVGISVDTATDVAKDAADILLLDKDLGVLADGIHEGRRIFANTIKYVMMATSSNFGNMFSAAGASLFLSYLPILPSQLLLNNLLYDTGQMTIPTDNVDEEMLTRPAQWDIRFIRRFMMIFGPISSIFDFATFGILLWVLHSSQTEFRTGWFVESLATQSLVIFIIRTRRIPFVRSRPSTPLLVATFITVTVGALLPYSPFASTLGFTRLPIAFLGILVVLICVYLSIAEIGKRYFYRSLTNAAVAPPQPVAQHRDRRARHVHRRAARFSTRRLLEHSHIIGSG
ncbi:MAG: magnesium-translocating P-type ATPase [Ilumatobacteraceae bacterium]